MGSIEMPVEPLESIDSLLAALTLEEKVSLLAAVDWWRTPVIRRNGVFVPHIKTTDGPNGARGESYVSGIRAACFPCSTLLGATFDVNLLYQTGRQIAIEARSKSASVLLAPTLNVIRSPLGGRNYETYSEDPLLLGLLSAAFVNGCQSEGIAATPKHFVANEAENRRKFLSVQIDEQTLREIYLLPFQLIMKLSKPLCFMTSYNRVNGEYVADSPRLVEDVLRREWGFDGLVMSDWMGTYTTADGVNAGVDLEMPGPSLFRGQKLLQAVKAGSVSEATIDKCSRRVLKLAKLLGRFENPEEAPEIEVQDPVRDEAICSATAEGMVILKNEGGVLPIPQTSTVALIGHLARVPSLGGGGSAKVNSLHAVTPIQGFEKLGIKHRFEAGVPVFAAVPHADPSIVSKTGGNLPPGAEGRPVKLEWFNGSQIGENLVHEETIPNPEYMIKEAWPKYLNPEYCTRMTLSITPTTTGDHTISIITTGTATLYVDDEPIYTRNQEPTLVMESFYFFKSKIEHRITHHMIAGRKYSLRLESWNADAEVLAKSKGTVFQGSAVRYFEYVDIDASIERAATAAAESDVAVVFVGNTNEIESEGYDRDTMDLLPDQYSLVSAVAAKNPKTIVVNFSGGPVNLTPIADSVAGLVQAWFPGQEGGHAIARVLMGHVNPSGRLPFSWPKRLEDNPSHGNFPVDKDDLLRYEEGLNIGYRYYDREQSPNPLFPFGFGLSYTTFQISDAKIATREMSPIGAGGTIEVSCRATNTGKQRGKLVIQLYVQSPRSEQAIGQERPVKELKAFDKVELDAEQSVIVSLKLDKYSVSIYDAAQACWRAQKGTYTVLIGTSVADIHANATFEVPEEFTWTGV